MIGAPAATTSPMSRPRWTGGRSASENRVSSSRPPPRAFSLVMPSGYIARCAATQAISVPAPRSPAGLTTVCTPARVTRRALARAGRGSRTRASRGKGGQVEHLQVTLVGPLPYVLSLTRIGSEISRQRGLPPGPSALKPGHLRQLGQPGQVGGSVLRCPDRISEAQRQQVGGRDAHQV